MRSTIRSLLIVTFVQLNLLSQVVEPTTGNLFKRDGPTQKPSTSSSPLPEIQPAYNPPVGMLPSKAERKARIPNDSPNFKVRRTRKNLSKNSNMNNQPNNSEKREADTLTPLTFAEARSYEMNDAADFEPYTDSQEHPIYNPPVLSSHNDPDPNESLESSLRVSKDDKLMDEVDEDISIGENGDIKNIVTTESFETEQKTESSTPNISINIEDTTERIDSEAKSTPNPKEKAYTEPPQRMEGQTTPEPAQKPTSTEATPPNVTSIPTVSQESSADQIPTEPNNLTNFPNSEQNISELRSDLPIEIDDKQTSTTELAPEVLEEGASKMTTLGDVELTTPEPNQGQTLTKAAQQEATPTPTVMQESTEDLASSETYEFGTHQIRETSTEETPDSTIQLTSKPTLKVTSEQIPDQTSTSAPEASYEPISDGENSQEESEEPGVDRTLLIVYTLFCTSIITVYTMGKHFLGFSFSSDVHIATNTPSELVKEVESKRAAISDMKQNLGLPPNCDLKEHQRALKEKNEVLVKRIEEQRRLAPLRQDLQRLRDELGSDISTKVSDRKRYLQCLDTLQQVDEARMDLREKVERARYGLLLKIRNFVSLKDLLDFMNDLEFSRQSAALNDLTFELNVKAQFLSDQIDIFRKVATQLVGSYESLKSEIKVEESRNMKLEDGLRALKKELEELKSNDSIDDWRRKVKDKESETDRYYSNYINNYQALKYQSSSIG